MVWSGLARRGGRKELGVARQGPAGRGKARQGEELGKAWRGSARLGEAWLGRARNKGEKLTAWNRQHKSNYEVFL